MTGGAITDTIQFTLNLTDNYYQRLKQARKNSILNTGRCWFDPAAVRDKTITVIIDQESIQIAYNTKKSAVQDSCSYSDVSTLIETKEGIFLRIEHKGFLFLPVSDTDTDNENLMEILRFLSKRCKYIHKLGNLSLPGVPFQKKLLFRIRPKQGVYLNSNGPFLILIPFLLLGLFMSAIMGSMIFQPPEIAKEDALSITATYMSCDPHIKKHKIKSINLEFSDAEELTVDGCCASKSLVEQLQSIPAGTNMKLLIHPISNDVLEIEVNGLRLLNFSESLTKLRRNAFALLGLGVLMLVACIAAARITLRKKQ